MKILAASLIAASMLGVTTVTAAEDRVGDFVNAYLKKKQVPGCALMVRHNGKVVLAAGYGFANLEHNVPVKPQTVFQSGSVGKQFLRWP
jgi:CubicO group peptidase (beta-lactamase class C family)